jgi:hypothetical protein
VTEPHAGDSPVRRAFLRGVLFAVALSVVLALCELVTALVSSTQVSRRVLLEPAIIGFAVGMLAGPTALVELLARRFRPGLRRDLPVALIALALTTFLLVFAVLQYTYTLELALGNGVDAGWRSLLGLARYMKENRLGFGLLYLGSAVPFAALSVTRLRGPRVAWQMVLVLVATGVLGLPLVAFAPRLTVEKKTMGLWLALAAALLPWIGVLADGVEERILAWASGEPRAAREPLRARLRGSIVPLVMALLVLGGELGGGGALLEWTSLTADQRAEKRYAPRLAKLAQGKLAPGEVAALVSEILVFDQTIRPRVGSKDEIVLFTKVKRVAPEGFHVVLSWHWSWDGAPVGQGTTQLRTGGFENEQVERCFLRPPGRAPGHHTIHLETRVSLAHETEGTWRELWAASRASDFPVEVLDVPCAVEMRVLPGLESALEATVEPGQLRVDVGPLPVALSGRFAILAANGARLGATNPLVVRAGEPVTAWVSLRRARSGSPITLVFEPDPKNALEETPDIAEVLSASLTKTFVYRPE